MALADFASIELTLPLEKSLPKKRNAMEKSIKHLTKTNSFGLSLQSTEATLLLGKLYQEFAKSLMASQRPTTLNKLQLEQYDILLQDEALPFEDKAIELHEINVSRIKEEIYTDSIARSLDELKRLLPGRYNKPELAPQVSHEIQ